MALSGMAIFKHMPKTNCGQCGVPTCLAFAMKLAAGGASLDQCPFVSEEAKAVRAEASAPPIRGVTIGEGEFALKVGEELVLHRHEKTFFNPCGYALLEASFIAKARQVGTPHWPQLVFGIYLKICMPVSAMSYPFLVKSVERAPGPVSSSRPGRLRPAPRPTA